MKKHPETKKSEITISVGPLNHCVHVNFQRWATEEEIRKMDERKEEIRKDVEEYFKTHPYDQEDSKNM